MISFDSDCDMLADLEWAAYTTNRRLLVTPILTKATLCSGALSV